MNILEQSTIRSPSGKDDVCAVTMIDTPNEPFVLHGIAEEGQEYTLSFYAMSKSSGGISVANNAMAVGADWKRYVVTFVADDVDLPIYFTATGTYYLYNTQLEVGNKDTDFALNPADTEQGLNDLTVVANNHSTQFSIMDGQISALIAEDVTMRGEYDALVSRTTAIEANLDGITSRVTLTEADISGVDRRLTEAESTIVQQAGEIALTVKEQDVTGNYIVGKLNLSSTTAKIAAKNIDLSGYVTVSSLKTAGATTIDGSNITTGTISADRIDAASLMAKKLTATNLTVTGNSVFSGALSGATGDFTGKITATSGKIGNWNIGGAIDATNANGNYIFLAAGTNGNQDVLVVRTGTDSSSYKYPIVLRATGEAIFSKANITGAVTATSITAKNEYYIHASSGTGTKARALYAADGSIGSTLMVGDGFSTLHLCGLLVNKDYGQVFCGEDGSWDFTAGTISVGGELRSEGNVRIANGAASESNIGVIIGPNDALKKVYLYNSRMTGNLWCQFVYNNTTRWSSITDFIVKNSSDVRLKDNIIPTKVNALESIDKMRACAFDRIDEYGKHYDIGFIADELEVVDPNLVMGGGYTSDGHAYYKSINELYLAAYAIKGIQELHTTQLTQADALLTLESRQDDQKVMIEYLLDENAKLKKQLKELEKSIA